MIELLLFYWVFSGLFIFGIQNRRSFFERIILFCLCLIAGGLLFPFFLGHTTKALIERMIRNDNKEIHNRTR